MIVVCAATSGSQSSPDGGCQSWLVVVSAFFKRAAEPGCPAVYSIALLFYTADMECGVTGLQVVIPKPSPEGPEHDPPGVGLVFLEYGDALSAEKARVALNGRSFEDRSVAATLVQSPVA